MRLVEEYRNGYPRLAAFIDADPGFAVVRRFGQLYSRNLLLQQDRLADIETRLNDIDSREETQWYLSSRRDDKNDARVKLVEELVDALTEYGTFDMQMKSWSC